MTLTKLFAQLIFEFYAQADSSFFNCHSQTGGKRHGQMKKQEFCRVFHVTRAGEDSERKGDIGF
jgi:hypothetical protein